jgi:hypothetical protein
MAVSDYYGNMDNNPNLNQMFGAIQQGYNQGRNFANNVISDQSSRRYGNVGAPSYDQPEITGASSAFNPNRPTYQQRQYQAPDLDRYGWGPGRGGQRVGESLSRYPGIYLETYGSGGRF